MTLNIARDKLKKEDLMQLKDKVIIVTGGGRGIGNALAVGYAQEGAKIVAASRRKGQG